MNTAKARMEQIANEIMDREGIARHLAWRKACKANPELRQKMNAEHTAAHLSYLKSR